MASHFSEMTPYVNALSPEWEPLLIKPAAYEFSAHRNQRGLPAFASTVYSKSRRIHNHYQKGLLLSVEASKCRSTG